MPPPIPPQDGVFEGGGLTQLLQQKTLVETELWELKAQLEKAGFTSLSQMRSDDVTMSSVFIAQDAIVLACSRVSSWLCVGQESSVRRPGAEVRCETAAAA